jgi:hypothetical protein
MSDEASFRNFRFTTAEIVSPRLVAADTVPQEVLISVPINLPLSCFTESTHNIKATFSYISSRYGTSNQE